MHPAALTGLYVSLIIAPLAIAAALMPRESDVLRELGIGAGIAAYAMLLLQFVSSGRYETMSGRVGIDGTIRFHQLAARAAAALVIAHPLLLVVPESADEWRDSMDSLVALFAAPQMLSGVIALALTAAIVAAGIRRLRLPIRYELWRASHAVLAIGIAAAGAHHAFTAGTYSETVWLRTYWSLLLLIALGSLLFVYAVKPLLLMRNAYRLVSAELIGPGIREIVLAPARGHSFRFVAGQFAWVTFDRSPVAVFDNPFSISSSPSELPQVRLLIKARGDTSGRLGELPAGSPVYLDGPHGSFTLEGRSGKAICLIAGGIGIAQIIGLLRDLAAKRDPRPIALLYAARNPALLVHADEIRALRERLDLDVAFSVDEPPPGWDGLTGNLDDASIVGALRAAPADCLCLACGPTPMMLAVERALMAAGVPAGQIVYERFEYD
jgi:predicted ferric reductase